MKSDQCIYSLFFLFSITLLSVTLTGCKKEDKPPEIQYGAVTDIDGNEYNAVTIGTQTWMVDNLKTTRYSNGDDVSTGLNDSEWENAISGAYAIYSNNDANNTTYGKLYNLYAVADSRHLCPEGWHAPSESEWITLIGFLGGEDVAGGKMKESGTTHWNTPNEASNSSNFTALPGGMRSWYGTFNDLGDYGYWWSATEGFAGGYWGVSTVHNEAIVVKYNYTPGCGFSVRCVKD
jgi:uncharacterized protein (TIGR02145 family)